MLWKIGKTTICDSHKICYNISGGENAICKISGVYSLMPFSIINIVHKTISKKQLKIENCAEVNGQFNIKITNVFSDIKRISKNPSLVLIEPYIQTSIGDKNSHTSCIRSFNSELQAKSFISYLNTRTVRFLVLLNAYTVALINSETWRFVPDPGPFDHIFTDAELYKKYNDAVIVSAEMADALTLSTAYERVETAVINVAGGMT